MLVQVLVSKECMSCFKNVEAGKWWSVKEKHLQILHVSMYMYMSACLLMPVRPCPLHYITVMNIIEHSWYQMAAAVRGFLSKGLGCLVPGYVTVDDTQPVLLRTCFCVVQEFVQSVDCTT